MYLRERYPDAVEAVLKDSRLGRFARSKVGPEAFETLVPRTVRFLHPYRDLCLQAIDLPFDQWLRAYSKEAAELWRRLEGRD